MARSSPTADFRAARWYLIRPSSSTRPRTYRCPLCGGRFAAMEPHMLVTPDGDPERRRHAHAACVATARQAGRLPLREEVEPRPPGLWTRLRARLAR
jgi:hypothetical protein